MKRLFTPSFLFKTIFIGWVVTFISMGCGKSYHEAKRTPTDTVLTIIIYRDGQAYSYGEANKVRFDTTKPIYTDKRDGDEKKLMRDSFYYMTYIVPIDSATAKKENKPLKDSLGNPTPMSKRVYIYDLSFVVWDGNVDIGKLTATNTLKQ